MTTKSYPPMVERIVHVTCNGRPVSPFLCTPEALRELACGNLLTSGMAERLDGIDVTVADDGTIAISGPVGASQGIEARMAALAPVHSDLSLPRAAVKAAADALVQVENWYGTHCIGIYVPEHPVRYFEDVGRHNAMDKCIGWAALQGADFSQCFVCATGRISVEMLVKAASVGIPLILSKKYPSDLAVSLAEKLGVCIAGRALNDEPSLYGDTSRITD